MNFKRTKKNLGGGSGTTVHDSKLFRVIHWFLQDGKQTEVELQIEGFASIEVRLEGHVELSSDKDCIKVFTSCELLRAFKCFEEKGFKEGKEHARFLISQAF